MGFQIITAAVAFAALLLSLVNTWVQLKDRWEERRVRGAPLSVLPQEAWTYPQYYFVRLSMANHTSVDRHVAECGFDVSTPRRPAWQRAVKRARRVFTGRRATLTWRGAVTVTGIGLDPFLLQSLAWFPDLRGTPFAVAASQTVTWTLAFVRFPWDEQTFEIVDIAQAFLYLPGASRALAATLTLVDDRGCRSNATVLIPWPAPFAGSPTPARS